VVVVSEDQRAIAAANKNMGLSAEVSGGDVGVGATGNEGLGTKTTANGDIGRAAPVSGGLGTVAMASKDLGAAAVRSADLGDWKMGNVETEKSRTGAGVTDRAAHPTSPRSTGFCAIWGCVSSSSSTEARCLARNLLLLPGCTVRCCRQQTVQWPSLVRFHRRVRVVSKRSACGAAATGSGSRAPADFRGIVRPPAQQSTFRKY